LLFQWFRLIIENRPNYEEDVTELNDINDIRNGVFANVLVHNFFDRRRIVILKVCHICPPVCPLSDLYVTAKPQTPNKILRTSDIPPRHDREDMPQGVSYPGRVRYTLQWLNPDPYAMHLAPNNSDAAFKIRTRKPKPSELLLHYNYGAAAVKCWGRGVKLLQDLTNPPRPPVPVPTSAAPATTIHDGGVAIRKRDAARAAGGAGAGNATAGAGTGELVESEGQVMWDEDDVILFFWGNSQVAKERHLKRVNENTERMEQWRDAVPHVSV
jgi:hypothetical protein